MALRLRLQDDNEIVDPPEDHITVYAGKKDKQLRIRYPDGRVHVVRDRWLYAIWVDLAIVIIGTAILYNLL